MDESRRTTQRRRALKEGRVVMSDSTSIDCLIRDMSDTGAKLQFSGPTTLPDELRLLVTSSNQLHPAKVAWQRGMSAGISFTGPAVDASPRKT